MFLNSKGLYKVQGTRFKVQGTKMYVFNVWYWLKGWGSIMAGKTAILRFKPTKIKRIIRRWIFLKFYHPA
jgi:hypothetical protein